MNLPEAIQQWENLLGEESVLRGTSATAHYGADTTNAHSRIAAALRITNVHHVQDVVRIAHQNRVPVYPVSTGNNWGYGSAIPAQNDCVILDLSPLQTILAFDSEMGVVTLEPGVTQQMLADFLDAGAHPYMVPVTGAGPHCSLIGNALERGYGITPHADHFGAVTDLEAVLPDGSLYRTPMREVGGERLARLTRWGIGPHSMGLFSQAGMGVVTRMSIVLCRRPACIKACFFALPNDSALEPAVRAIRTLLTALPGTLGGINLMNRHRILSMSAPYPAQELGSDGLIPESVIQRMGREFHVLPWTGLASLYGTERVVAAAQTEVKRALRGIASRVLFLTPARAKTLSRIAHWIPGKAGMRMVRVTDALKGSLELLTGRPNETALALAYWRDPQSTKMTAKNPARDGCGLIWYAPLVPMRTADVRAYVDMVSHITRQHGMEPLITLTSINDRLFDSTVPLLFTRAHPPAAAAAQDCYQQLLETGRLQGCFPYRVGINTMPTLMALQTHARVFHERLRRDLDPHNILAPGRYR